MKKILLWLSGAAVTFLMVYLVTGYHTTPSGAFEELQQSTESTLIPTVDEGKVMLIDKNGELSIALMITERRFLVNTLYTDFEVFPTDLNVFDANLDRSIAFLNAPNGWEHAYGLVKNKKVKYLADSWYPEHEKALKVYPLTDYINNSDAKDIVLWYYPQELEKDTLQSSLYFLDVNEKSVGEIENDYVIEEFFVKNMNSFFD